MLNFETAHRERKRKAEMNFAIGAIKPFLKTGTRIQILEFGSGDGYQIPYLKRLGNVITSDIYVSERSENGTAHVVCDIKDAPFASDSFDLVFSNHVLEHIEDVKKAFAELKRIGRGDCVYAFAVPTNIWLLLSIPAQAYNALGKLFKKSRKARRGDRPEMDLRQRTGWKKVLPVGHGWREGFMSCFNAFKIGNWKGLFEEGGFEVMTVDPLLLYAPSEFPIVPTVRLLANKGLCSSAIFILKKRYV
ncbi:MAG: class I SAM-dependent methyltransferase [Candidatus Omnitrophica bacterium]|nr:class I SAM-dependent methyltransferase [Candidatus Omnitrophota bacterium]